MNYRGSTNIPLRRIASQSADRDAGRSFDKRFLAIALFATMLMATGCAPGYYRTRADKEVYSLVNCVGDRGHWTLPDFSVDPGPQSRMYDPDCPDHPPMPPDDPDSHKLMHCVDGKKGFAHWHKDGDTDTVENAAYLNYLPRDEHGMVVLDLGAAIRTALVNSPQYQSELEDVYLSALDVTFERFRFDVQFFGGYSATYTADGQLRSGDSSSELELSTFPAGRNLQARRFFTTGSEMVVGLANSIVWQFSGTNTTTYNSLVDFSFVQPLLRRAGKDVIMERLTISERTLLANVRQMERYRQAFSTDVATGRNVGQGPARRGGVFGGAGLEGFTGTAGGFGRVGNVAGQQGAAGDGGIAGGAGAARAGGYFGLLQAQQEIRNLQENVAALRDSLERLEMQSKSPKPRTPEAIRLLFQVELARQALHNASSRLLTAQHDYEALLDNYKIRLGLPPDLPVAVKDPLLDRFNLIDDTLIGLQSSGDRVLIDLQPPPSDEATYRAGLQKFVAELERGDKALRATLERHTTALSKLGDVRADVKKLKDSAVERRAWLERLTQKFHARQDEVDAETISVERFETDLAALVKRFAEMEQSLTRTRDSLKRQSIAVAAELVARRDELSKLQGDGAGDLRKLIADRKASFDRTAELVRQLSDDIAEMWIVEAKARLESIVLTPVDLKSEDALAIASMRRQDWMNARASVVDAWRLIRFNADALESELDIVFSGDMGTVGNNPAKFDAATGRLRVGLQFDAPLTRLGERNNYRQSLIEYNQARRNYYTFVDRVNQSLRGTLRTMELNQINFELRRSAVHTALTQVDLARKQLLAPLRPNVEGPIGQANAPADSGQTGEIGRDLVTALSDLTQVQNDFLSVWLNYHVLRMALDLDLGTMQVDENGMWIEPEGYDVAALLGHAFCGQSPERNEELPSGEVDTGAEPLELRRGKSEKALPPPAEEIESAPPDDLPPPPPTSPSKSSQQPPPRDAAPTKSGPVNPMRSGTEYGRRTANQVTQASGETVRGSNHRVRR